MVLLILIVLIIIALVLIFGAGGLFRFIGGALLSLAFLALLMFAINWVGGHFGLGIGGSILVVSPIAAIICFVLAGMLGRAIKRLEAAGKDNDEGNT